MNPSNALDKTHVSILLPFLRGYGAERVILNLTSGLAQRSVRVDLVLLGSAGIFSKDVHSGVRLIELGLEDLRTRSSLQKILAISRYLKQERPDVLISVYDTLNLVPVARLLANSRTRIINSVHVQLSKDLESKGIKGKLEPYLFRLTYAWADRVIAVSQGVAEDVAHLTGIDLTDIQVIHNPVVTPELLVKAKEPVSHPWFAPEEPPVILGVGRLEEQKNFSTLIQAFALVRKLKESRLVIIGEGSQRSALESLIDQLDLKDNVCLPGYLDSPYEYMSKAAIFVLSSEWEGLPTVLVEAMAVGTPVVSTDCRSGPAEILQGGQYGKLVPVGNVEILADAILTTLNEPMSADLLQQRSKTFSIEGSVEKYLSLLNNLH
jgi:glycosyltransferase involved in cell wall biosynthesis